jgi:hypothetical protein
MSDEFLGERRKALEEEFFRKQDEKLRAQLRARLESQAHREALARASGITDAAVLDRLVGLGLDADTVAALALVPLVRVAWADGRMDERERQAVRAAARERGIDDASPAGLLLEGWLSTAPPSSLREAWVGYVQALCARLSAPERERLREEVLGRARAVADAAGGFLGLGSKVSQAERDELARLETAFG